jgi:hypothetical protein
MFILRVYTAPQLHLSQPRWRTKSDRRAGDRVFEKGSQKLLMIAAQAAWKSMATSLAPDRRNNGLVKRPWKARRLRWPGHLAGPAQRPDSSYRKSLNR